MRDRTLLARGEPAEVLLRSARALRRLGARITRYEATAGALEARTREWGLLGVVRLNVDEGAQGQSRVRIASDYHGAGLLRRGAAAWTVRRLTIALTRPEPL